MAKSCLLKNRWVDLYDATRCNNLTPKVSGIYCFIHLNIYSKKRKVVYVGKSCDLSVRLKPWHKVEHVYRNQCREFGDTLLLKIMPTDDYHTKEIEYIKRFKPLFNVCHNPSIKRKITYENAETLY